MRVLCFCVLQDLEDELWPQAILRWTILEPSVLLDSSDSPHPLTCVPSDMCFGLMILNILNTHTTAYNIGQAAIEEQTDLSALSEDVE